ncbi:MAG: glycosyltransferase family 4 protein [Proteobacteria bacterium]|nr:glycosyltransferase family 4 protein [Pseudomonadota bacterium]MBU1419476.1 glycosyltransferase family 4 protein [Pseudomonadota bacterium]MBU1455167.1 glycosyltransferase family 4 protein [Pseudomonadota bacterium]
MRVLFFSTYYHPYLSGLITYPKKILTYLSNNHNITIITFRYSKNLPQHSTDGKIAVHRLPFLVKISKGFISPQSLIAFAHSLRTTDIVILNIPNFEALPLAIFAKIWQKPIISIFHCRVDLGKRFFNRIIAATLNLSVSLQLWLSDTIVIYTQDYFEHLHLEKRFTHKTKVILPAVSQPKVNEHQLERLLKQKRDNTWIGFCGRVSKEKGIHHLINAIDTLTGKNKHVLIIAGPYGDDVVGESQYYNEIKSLLGKKKITCIFLGKLSDGNLGAFYRAIDVLVLPSVNRTEAFGMVQVDAMLSGKPVIASNLPGVRIPINLTNMGVLVEPGDEDGLAQAIIKIISQPQRYSNSQLRDHARKVFSEQSTYDCYDQLLADITDES